MGRNILTNSIGEHTPIYRVISEERLLQIFQNRENVLVRPKLWEDTFENLALQSATNLNGERVSFGFKDDVYAQCWTQHAASDAMWRIYSNGTDGIRIKTTVGKLLNSLKSWEAQKSSFADVSCFIGKVSYEPEKGLRKFADEHFKNGIGTNGVKIAQTLLVKRRAFEHEKEIRLIYSDPNPSPSERDLLPYNLDPHNLIDQIMLHPQISVGEANELKYKIQKRLGFRGEIKRSLLYRLPQNFVFKVKEQ